MPAAPVPRPVVAGEWDVVIVPLVAFDRFANRLGNGAGHYDRLLARHRRPSIGIAFDTQRIDAVPIEAHDVALDMVVTESGVVRPAPGHAPPEQTGGGVA